ncbi:hypothetical protein Q8W40_16985 [Vibrio penaeicida]|nr:hypothetical protein [Vibrio penaeicida]MDP2573891.1 hypothetical protein [Vibrio penaeicida]
MNSQAPVGSTPNSSTPKPLPLPNRYHRGTGHWRTPQQSRPAKR